LFTNPQIPKKMPQKSSLTILSFRTLAIRADAEYLKGMGINTESILLSDTMYPLLWRLYLYSPATMLTNEVMMMFIILADAKHLLVIEVNDIRFAVVGERIKLTINRGQPDSLSLLVEDTMKFLSRNEVITP
jgi:hypothetical protein